MGQALSNAIKSIDGSADAEKQIKDALTSLYALGESRNDAAFAKATSDAMKVYAPINKVLLQRQSIVASASVGTDKILDGIKGAVGNLMKGQILDGVADIIGSALNVVLGSSAGQISSSHTYALVATDLGALLRLDVDVYSFEVTSSGLQNHAKNMTAITSIISTVLPNSITSSDIRGIVSLSYGNSPIETQQQIYDLVKQAWENDRKVVSGLALTSEDHDNFQSLLVPSRHEQAMRAREEARKGLASLSLPRAKVSRSTLEAARKQVQQRHVKSLSVADTDSTTTTTTSNNNASAIDVYLWVKTTEPVDSDWVSQMTGALSGFNVPDMLRVVGVDGGKSGSAITFKIQISGPTETFDQSIAYLNDTVIPALNRAQYLNASISSMALQYNHPSKTGEGYLTRVQYRANEVINRSNDTVAFFKPDSETALLTIAPRQSGVLNGAIDHIATVPTAATNAPGTGSAVNGDVDGDTGLPPSGPVKPTVGQATKIWVTYEDIDPRSILTGQRMFLDKIEIGEGYVLSFHTNDDALMQISYNVGWEASNGEANT